MGEEGSVSWQFTRGAYFALSAEGVEEEEIFEAAVEAGADDVILGEEDIEILAPLASFKAVSDRLKEMKIKPEESEVRMFPNTEITLPAEQAVKVMRIIEDLEDLDDVRAVFSNLDITEEAVHLLEEA